MSLQVPGSNRLEAVDKLLPMETINTPITRTRCIRPLFISPSLTSLLFILWQPLIDLPITIDYIFQNFIYWNHTICIFGTWVAVFSIGITLRFNHVIENTNTVRLHVMSVNIFPLLSSFGIICFVISFYLHCLVSYNSLLCPCSSCF